MLSGVKRLCGRCLIGITMVLFALFVITGCSGDNRAESSFRSPQEDILKDIKDIPGPSVPASPGLQALNAADMLTVPAGTVIFEEQVDRAHISEYFVSVAIPDDIYLKIDGRSYVENPYVSLDDLRYLKLLHYNFDHAIQVGELIVSADLADEVLDIFLELFDEEYEIYSLYLVEDFWTEDAIVTDDESCFANNSSAFSYRYVTYGGELSLHAFGEAIDINPLQNPYVEYYYGEPWWLDSNADDYIDRDAGLPHMIDYDDACYQAFTSRGWTWGGDWWSPKDYQHFEK